MQTIEQALEKLRKSKFRSGFHLDQKDKAYIREKGMDTIRKHAEDFVAARLAPAVIPNDGKQTPWKGHPVFKAQHACACCCRGCLNKWYRVPKGIELTQDQQQRLVNLLMAWIYNEMEEERKVKMKDILNFRSAERKDIPLILQFIKELADYENMLNEVVADEETLETWIFDKQKAEVIFAVENEKEVGFALFFHNFSTFLGRAGLYLEDLYVRPEFRGKGYGKAILKKLAAIAVERGCGRLEWWCLDWNKPSIDFYLSLGAEPMSDWTVYRIAGDTLKHLAE